MKKILFYCQNLLGLGHLVRTTEIIRHLSKDFKVCLVQGGTTVQGFEIPQGVETIHLPAIQLDPKTIWSENRSMIADSSLTLEEVKEIRKNMLLKVFDVIQPDCLITEGFPFSKKQSLSFELVPLLDRVKTTKPSTKVVCSLRDIFMVKQFEDRSKEEAERCDFLNQYYDLLLYHSDPKVHRLEESFSMTEKLNCQVCYTGYVAQSIPENTEISDQDIASLSNKNPMILVSVGGGKLGYELLDAVIKAAPILEKQLPHKIQIFTGPLMPDEKFLQLYNLAANYSNINIRRFTTQLIAHMEKASLSISLGGYNTTMNVLKTGVRSLIYPSNKDREQAIRAEKLEEMGILEVIRPEDLNPARLAEKIVNSLNKKPVKSLCQTLNLQGAEKTAQLLRNLLELKLIEAA
ncbi:MAG TPA: glycosyl transferase [Cyanobacteria bacterium UBA11369]|nr:glycosyl transferase [Cyanobacteria bacterium UBA11371]HBE31205.1 glycosyl transferase [Cyanobacteria bacterium UBA11368]HBE48160.1 glycosyl transferase [Cyanobacteria bacterium UBA11369]